jgi:protein-tyrosine phosphatase
VLRAQLAAADLAAHVEVDSCGIGGWHVGELPDPRTVAAARRRGLELTHRARKLHPRDLDTFDYVLAMDGEHLAALSSRAGRAKVALLRSFEPGAAPGAEVPDPYYGGDDGFEEVLDLCERACRGFVEHLRRELAW